MSPPGNCPRSCSPAGLRHAGADALRAGRRSRNPGSVDLTPPLYVVSQYRQASQVTSPPVTSEQFVQLYHTDDGRFNAARDSADYRAPILQAYDDVGQVYRYVQGWFTETVGSSSVTITPGSASVTATKIQGKIRWATSSKRRPTMTPTGPRSTASRATRSPSCQPTTQEPRGQQRQRRRAQAATLQGLPGLPGVHPRGGWPDRKPDQPARRRAHLSPEPRPTQLCRSPSRTLNRSALAWQALTSPPSSPTGEPWAWTLERLIEWIPIRPYRREGRIRFAWVGPVREEQIAATIDLDELGPWYRTEPMSWARRPVAGGFASPTVGASQGRHELHRAPAA